MSYDTKYVGLLLSLELKMTSLKLARAKFKEAEAHKKTSGQAHNDLKSLVRKSFNSKK